MKKKLFITFVMIFSMFFVGFSGLLEVNAEGTFTKNIKAMTANKGTALTKIAKTGAIPAEYGTFGFFKYTGDYPAEYANVKTVPTAVKNAWGTYSSNDDTWKYTFNVGDKKPTLAQNNYSICVPHAALYNGKWIDIKGTVTDFEKSTYKNYEKANANRKPTIAFVANPATHRVSVTVQAINWVTVKWEFKEYDPSAAKGKHCAGAAVSSVNGNTSYRDVDMQQGIRLTGSTNKGLYVTNGSNTLKYGNVKNGSGTSARHVFSIENKNNTNNSDSYAFTEVFSASSYMTRTYTFVRNANNLARGGIGMEYVSYNPITPANPTKSESTETLKEGAEQVYTVSQAIPFQDKSNYHGSVIIQDTLDDCYDMNNTKYEIKSQEGADVSSYFTLSADGSTIKATAIKDALGKEDFYGKTYQLVITTRIKNGYDFSKYDKTEKGYVIHNKGTSIIDGKERPTNDVVSYYTPPKCVRQYDNYYDNEGNIVSKEKYYEACPGLTEMPDPIKAVNADLIRYGKEYNYGIVAKVPYVTSSNFYKSYVISDTLEAPLKVTNSGKIKVFQTKVNPTDENEDVDVIDSMQKWTDVTNKFTINVDGQKVTATLKDTNDADFYGTRDEQDEEIMKKYGLLIPVALKDNVEKSVDMTKYAKDGKYVIPDVANVKATKSDGKDISKDTNEVDVYYEEDLPAQKSVNVEDVTSIRDNGGSYTYTIEKSVVNYGKEQYYTSFVMQDKFEDCISIKDASSVKVLNEGDLNVTNWFNISLSGQTLKASLKNEYNNDKFYGHKYRFIVTAGIKQNASLKKYKQGGKYVIPNVATFTYDGDKTIKTNKVNVTIDIPVVKKISAPNTASPAIIGAIVAGILAIVVGGYLILTQMGIDPLAKLKK